MSTHARPQTEATAAIVLAAGRGERLGHALPKAFVPLAGRTLIEHSIRSIAASGCFQVIVPVLARADFERFSALDLSDVRALAPPIEGGAERQDSVRSGLAALPTGIDWVAVHDAARCLVSAKDVERVVAAACESGAAILGAPATDTIKIVGEDGLIQETPPRPRCWAAQTPQVARRAWLETAHASASASGRLGTDDAQLLEWAGRAVRVVEALWPNPKITRPEDLQAAEAMCQEAAGGTAPAQEAVS